MCNREILLDEHPSGLVFEDRIFICEDCCSSHSIEEINRWSRTVMENPTTPMPIALWLIHEENKDKTMMTVKKA